MSAVHSAKLQIDVNADHSCNWRCCWGCRKVVAESPKQVASPTSFDEVETTEKVTHTVTRHFHGQEHNPVNRKL